MAAAAPARPHGHSLCGDQPAGASWKTQPSGQASDGGHQAGGEHPGPGICSFFYSQVAAAVCWTLTVPQSQDH